MSRANTDASPGAHARIRGSRGRVTAHGHPVAETDPIDAAGPPP